MPPKDMHIRNHYIPRLLLRQFSADNRRINIWKMQENKIQTVKISNAFASYDVFPPELENMFAEKLEGPFGDLLNHKLLSSDNITINRYENLLIRKFIMIESLRSPLTACTWEEMVEKTELSNHPSVLRHRFMMDHYPEYRKRFESTFQFGDDYLANLETAMKVDSIEDIADSDI